MRDRTRVHEQSELENVAVRGITLEDSTEACSFADTQLNPCYLFLDVVPDGHEGGATAAELAWTA